MGHMWARGEARTTNGRRGGGGGVKTVIKWWRRQKTHTKPRFFFTHLGVNAVFNAEEVANLVVKHHAAPPSSVMCDG